MIKIGLIFQIIFILFITSCNNKNSLFESPISKPTVFIEFDQDQYEFAITKINTASEITLTIDPKGGVSVTQISAKLEEPFRFKGDEYPGTGGTCGEPVTDLCSMVIEFAPTTYGNYESELILKYWTGKKFDEMVRPLKGDTNAGLTLTPASFQFGQKVLKVSGSKTFTVTHIGGTRTKELIPQALSAPFSITSHTCVEKISVGDTCQVTVRFRPTIVNTYTDQLEINFNDYIDDVTLSSTLLGEGIPPARLTITPAAGYDFGMKANTSTQNVVFTVSYLSGAVPAEEITLIDTPSSPFSLTTGICSGGGLNTGQSCTYTLTFAPTVTNTHNDSFSLRYFDGAEDQTIIHSFTAQSEKQAILSFLHTSPQTFGIVNVGTSQDMTITIQNDLTSYFPGTSVTTSGLSAPITFKGGTFPGTGGDCGTSIAPGTCTIVLTYTPTAVGIISRTLTLNYHNGASNQSISLTLNGQSQATINASVSTLAFSNTTINANRDLTLTLTNAGGTTATSLSPNIISLPFRYKGGTYPGTGGNCGTSLNSFASCTIIFNFAPTAAVSSSNTFSIDYFDHFNTQTTNVSLTGTGLTPAQLELGSTIDFGLQNNNTTTEHSLTVVKSGQTNATSVGFTLTGTGFSYKGGSFPGTGGTCSATITANCTVILRYLPTATNTYNGVLSVSYNTGAITTSDTVNLSGTSITAATLAFSPTSYNFGTRTLTTVNETTITITNSGEVNATTLAMNLSAPFTFKGATYPGTGGTCGTTLNFGQSCTIVVNYTPAAAVLSSQSFSISYDNGFNSTSSSMTLSGTGTTPAQLELGSTINFGERTNGSSNQHTLTVVKTGQTDATSVVFDLSGTAFIYKGGSFPGTGGTCSALITGNCTVILLFEPTVTNTYSGSLSVDYSTGATTTSDSVNLEGTSITPAVLTLTPSTFDFETQVIGSVTELSITVSNSGEGTAANIELTLAAPFAYKDDVFPGTGGNCSTQLNGLDSCTLIVVYSPTTVDGDILTNDLNYHNGLFLDSVELSLSGIGEVINLLEGGGSLRSAQQQINVIKPQRIERTIPINKFQKDISGRYKWNKLKTKRMQIMSSFNSFSVQSTNYPMENHENETKVELEGLKIIEIADFNDDQVKDILMTRDTTTQGEIRILSGENLEELDHRVLPHNSLPISVHRIGDINKDKIDEYFIGTYRFNKLIGISCIDGQTGEIIFKVTR